MDTKAFLKSRTINSWTYTNSPSQTTGKSCEVKKCNKKQRVWPYTGFSLQNLSSLKVGFSLQSEKECRVLSINVFFFNQSMHVELVLFIPMFLPMNFWASTKITRLLFLSFFLTQKTLYLSRIQKGHETCSCSCNSSAQRQPLSGYISHHSSNLNILINFTNSLRSSLVPSVGKPSCFFCSLSFSLPSFYLFLSLSLSSSPFFLGEEISLCLGGLIEFYLS